MFLSVAPRGIEPRTHGFSVHCSTYWAKAPNFRGKNYFHPNQKSRVLNLNSDPPCSVAMRSILIYFRKMENNLKNSTKRNLLRMNCTYSHSRRLWRVRSSDILILRFSIKIAAKFIDNTNRLYYYNCLLKHWRNYWIIVVKIIKY